MSRGNRLPGALEPTSSLSSEREVRERISRRFGGRWLRGYASSKLRTDPLYEAVWERLCRSSLPLLDIGCGVGLLSFYLRERGFDAPILGIDSDGAKIETATEIATVLGDDLLRFERRSAVDDLEFEGNIVIADVIHYLGDDEQVDLLRRVAGMVPRGGMAIVRDSPRDGSWRHRVTWLEEVFARSIGWMRTTVLNFPTRERIAAPFNENFEEEALPLWGRTPFNSHLFVYRRIDD